MPMVIYLCPRCGHEEPVYLMTEEPTYPQWCYRCQEMGDGMEQLQKKEKPDANL